MKREDEALRAGNHRLRADLAAAIRERDSARAELAGIRGDGRSHVVAIVREDAIHSRPGGDVHVGGERVARIFKAIGRDGGRTPWRLECPMGLPPEIRRAVLPLAFVPCHRQFASVEAAVDAIACAL